ncbi:MAG: response regulator [Nitrospira sp.]|nr:response regulator [Nitrospira sp.]
MDVDRRQDKAPLDFLVSGGDMATRIGTYEWSAHPLGLPHQWPHSLKLAVRIMLTSRYAMWMGWGSEFYFFCNDAYLPTVGIKADWVLGASARRVWAEIWDDIGPRAESVVRTGCATWDQSLPLFLERSGMAEETYHTFSYSPLPDDDGAIGGMLCVVTEDTERVIGERRLTLLRELAADLTGINSERELFAAIEHRLIRAGQDLPFTVTYLLDPKQAQADLACSSGVMAGEPTAPDRLPLHVDGAWPIGQQMTNGEPVIVEDLASRFTSVPAGPWNKAPRQAVVIPLMQQGQDQQAGWLIAGLNPYRPFDQAYRGFLMLLAGQVSAGLSNARSYEQERQRAEALAELDRAKTAFFSNVSHEFRTPLTLMLGPVDDLLAHRHGTLAPQVTNQLEVINRNGARLLRLVNSLLDFSRIEAGRVQARYEATDLSALTADLASSFRSATESAGLQLAVDCPPLPEPVYMDRDMWEKIVLNLLSNAFKFTFEGAITVTVRHQAHTAELTVRDTGVGIPKDAIPRLFERFYRVEEMRSRTHEGSGIGLALVKELVKLHGGDIRAESELGRGSRFIVTIPLGTAHLPVHRLVRKTGPRPDQSAARHIVEEALRWLPAQEQDLVMPEHVGETAPATDTADAGADGAHAPRERAASHESPTRPRVLVVDDNADMRRYVAGLLSERYLVETAADGEVALTVAGRMRPDLILSDVMMPRLDGFALLEAVRADAALRMTPVILLSARAGEEACVGGLDRGADDYLIKPFSARELLARVAAHLDLAKIRKESADAVRQNEARFRAFITATSDVVYCMNADWSEMRYLDGKQFLANTERPRRDWLEAYLHPDDQPQVTAAINQAIRTKTMFSLIHRVIRVDGTLGWTVSRAVPMLGSNEDIVEWFGAARDITEEMQANLLLTEHKDLLERVAIKQPLYDCVSALTESVTRLHPTARAALLVADADGTAIGDCYSMHLPLSFTTALRGSPIAGLPIGTYTDKPITCPDVARQAHWPAGWRDLCLAHDIKACHSEPVFDEAGQPIASFFLCLTESRTPTTWERRLAEFGANLAGIVLERHRVDQALDQEIDGMRKLHGMGLRLAQNDERLVSLIEEVLRSTRELVKSDRCSAQLCDPDSGTVRVVASVGFDANPADPVSIAPDDHGLISAEVVRTHEQVIVEDISADPGCAALAQCLAPYGAGGVLCHPLLAMDDTVLGLLTMYWSAAHRPNERELRHLELYVQQAVRHIERQLAHDALRHSEDRLRVLTMQLEDRVQARTEDLLLSQDRLRALATELNLAEQRERQRLAAELHDHLQQLLVLGKMKLNQGMRRAEDLPQVAQCMKETETIFIEALSYTRSLVAELSPPVLREHGLAAGLSWLGDYMQKRGMMVTVEVPAHQHIMLAEEQGVLLFQSVRELLLNAAKHAGTQSAWVTMRMGQEDLVITVQDKGMGFDPVAVAGSSRPEPLKFGLFSIRERMKALDGTFEIRSAPGEGTTAMLTLPISVRSPAGAPLQPTQVPQDPVRRFRKQIRSSGSPALSGPIRILLVDDHPMVREGLRMMLENCPDFELVGEASNGREAVQLAASLKPEVILMDINMPIMDGIQATARIAEQNSDCHIIGLSVNAGRENQEAMINAGARALITKEVPTEQLYDAIRHTAWGSSPYRSPSQ